MVNVKLGREKKRTFLDTSVLIEYVNGNPEIKTIFSNTVVRRFRFVTDPIVMQRVILFSNKMNIPPERLNIFSNRVKIIRLQTSLTDFFRQEFSGDIRNMIIHDRYEFHSNDFLSIWNAIKQNVELFCTLDRELLQLSSKFPITFTTPMQIIEISKFGNNNKFLR